MESMFTNIMALLSSGVTAAGAFLIVWGAINVGSSLNDHNGPGIQQGIMRIVGGAVVTLAAAYFTSISITG